MLICILGVDLNLGTGIQSKGPHPYGHLFNKSIHEQLSQSGSEKFASKPIRISPAQLPIKPAISTASFPGLINFTASPESPSMISRSLAGPFPVSAQFPVGSPESGLPRKRGRPRKNPDEPRKKRGAIEYDPSGDSCTSILMEYKQSLIRRANQQRLEMLAPTRTNQNSGNRAVNRPASADSSGSADSKISKNRPSDKSKISIIMDRFHNFDPNSNIL